MEEDLSVIEELSDSKLLGNKVPGSNYMHNDSAKQLQPPAANTEHVYIRKSSVRNLSRRTLSTIPAAQPDGLWFLRSRDEPFYPRYKLPTTEHVSEPSNNEDTTTTASCNSRRRRLQQTIVSVIMSVACYLCLLLSLPTIALVLWKIFRQRTGGVFALPGENSTRNVTFGK
jgi:hypothetical protein